ncbi:hypothetical protein MIND_00707900 [Mycena indigotica]|uniref:Asl1-like glycosyl hydrolase catalytic domain-containing protein n=1 Tax=Mycena indigotica TaxID=2126181 RepID=A0A8H6W3C6_9AGAR|nr:uncharacterized protein MIND_00707900 [Mycena indigotica]KAF7301426.1 hypothetical protein MIND_00707900 [Mycena indigotica]
MAPSSLLSIVSVTLLAVLSSTVPSSVNAVSLQSGNVVRSHHDIAVARSVRKRASNAKRCKPRAASSALESKPSTAPKKDEPAKQPAQQPSNDNKNNNNNNGGNKGNNNNNNNNNNNKPPSGGSSTGPVTVGNGVQLRGKACLAWPNYNYNKLSSWQGKNVGLIYSWDASKIPGADELGFTYAPMLWGWKNAEDFKAKTVPGYAKIALGPNEPNEVGQSNMDAWSGIQIWRQYMLPLASKGYTLLSPAMSSRPNGKDWMKTFMNNCGNDCAVSGIATHYYGTDLQEFKNYITYWHDTYNLPVYITEYADQNFNGGRQATMDEIWAFMVGATDPLLVRRHVRAMALTTSALTSSTTKWPFTRRLCISTLTAYPNGPTIYTEQLFLPFLSQPTLETRVFPGHASCGRLFSAVAGLWLSTLEFLCLEQMLTDVTSLLGTIMVKHLPPTIKHLLTLRNPNSLPPPSASKLQSVLTSSYRSALDRNATTAWLVLTACTLTTVNRPSTMAQLYRFIRPSDAASRSTGASSSLGEAINKAALVREAVLKSVIFVGVPRVILSFAAFNEALDADVRAALRTTSRRDGTSRNIDTTVERGKALWRSIYTPHAEKLHDKLGSYHPDFISFIIQSYGTVLSPLPGETRSATDLSGRDDPDQGNLSRTMGSVVGIACLRAEERVVPQLTSHVFGLLKAREIEGKSEEDSWLASDEGTEWVIRTVDEIVEVVKSEDSLAQVKL